MSTVCGRPQGGGGPAHVDACGQGEGGQKRDFFVDVINEWPLACASLSPCRCRYLPVSSCVIIHTCIYIQPAHGCLSISPSVRLPVPLLCVCLSVCLLRNKRL